MVTDSGADVSPQRAEELGVGIVPLPVFVGDDSFEDGTLTQEQLFKRIRAAAPKLAGTSQPSPGMIARAYERALEDADEVIALHMSSRLSGTCDLARMVSHQFDGRVHIFDSRSLSPDRAEALADAIRERWQVDELVMYEAGSAISVHAGTIWGVAFRPRVSR